MRTVSSETSTLLVIDFQSRLMPAIEDGAASVANARRLINAATMLDIPILFTEQNPKGLGPTIAELPTENATVIHKMTFDATRADTFPDVTGSRPDVVVVGCEAHVCVLQTVLGLLDAGRKVFVARDAIGSRRGESKETAVSRMERHGAEIVTAEMVLFEWLGTAEHPRFREAVALIK